MSRHQILSPDREQNVNWLRPVCYLIHFETPYQSKTGTQTKKAQHYLGWTINLDKRVKLHASGKGAKLLAIVNAESIPWAVVRIWADGSYSLEKKLKARHNHAGLCPICTKKHRNVLPKEPLGTAIIGAGADGQAKQEPDESLALLLLRAKS